MMPKEMFNRFQLPTQEYVTCVLWCVSYLPLCHSNALLTQFCYRKGVFYITGTDIVRCLTFRFQAFGRPIKNPKKFEEGIFSDLRNLKPCNDDALLEEPKSTFLELLYKNSCIRTQKKQKVFNWFSVPHDRLFLDALERDLKRESMGQEATTEAVSEPALSFQYDPDQTLFEQLMKALQQSATSSIDAESMLDSYNMGAPDPAWNMAPPPVPTAPTSIHSLPADQLAALPPNSQTLGLAALRTDLMESPAEELSMVNAYPTDLHEVVPQNILRARREIQLEASPAPSFDSSVLDDPFDVRMGMSNFEPMTPDTQHSMPFPEQYIDAPYYNTYETEYDESEYGTGDNIPYYPSKGYPVQHHHQQAMPPNQMADGRQRFPNPMMAQRASLLGGSPVYKQRRRRSLSGQPYPHHVPNSSGLVGEQHQRRYVPMDMPSSSRPLSSNSAGSMRSEPTILPSHNAVRRPYVGQQRHHHAHDNHMHMVQSLQEEDDYVNAGEYMGDDYSQYLNYNEVDRHSLPPHLLAEQQQQYDYQYSMALQSPKTMPRYSGSGAGGPIKTKVQRQDSGAGPYSMAATTSASSTGSSGRKSHTCPVASCGRIFARLEHLKRHVRTHTNERPYKCKICNRGFSRSDNLAQHRRTHDKMTVLSEDQVAAAAAAARQRQQQQQQQLQQQPFHNHHHHSHHQQQQQQQQRLQNQQQIKQEMYYGREVEEESSPVDDDGDYESGVSMRRPTAGSDSGAEYVDDEQRLDAYTQYGDSAY
ncbi:transcription factor STE12 [Myxozyma melibiosi]|uniref:Transcription factor STE12 n=1 Tax=Myxozyma melibiosi TaxID=54550 RepID=A0ABR1F8M1_9ASCO